ncbi:MAG: site-specific integrase [bacterium]|nr:site-specific integrase [bacterium]
MRKTQTPRQPKYCLHKATGQAFVWIGGRNHYLGSYDSAESREEYDRLVGMWLANNRRLPSAEMDRTVSEVLEAFWEHAKVYYRRPDGTKTNEQNNLWRVIDKLDRMFGTTLANDFTPSRVHEIREAWIKAGHVRSQINRNTERVKRIFAWAVEYELVKPDVHHGLRSVTNLKAGRCAAKESEPVLPVEWERVEAVKPHVTRQVWAMVELQWLTGMRAGEVTQMRPCDIDMSDPESWVYRPLSFKTQHFGYERLVEFGPRAQEVIRPFLTGRRTNAYLFSPSEAMAEWRAERHHQRKTRMSNGNRPGTNRNEDPQRTPSDQYDAGSYGCSIRKACDKAGIPRWHSHQLRHAAATRIRKQFGLDEARAVLGHRSTPVTEVYAERDRAMARKVMAEVG